MTGDETGPQWPAVAMALAARSPVVVLLEGDTGNQLTAWRPAATQAGIRWLETAPASQECSPFGLWSRLAAEQPGASGLLRRLRLGPDWAHDPGNPLLPDPVGTHRAIYHWLMAYAPVVAVLDATGYTDWDSWAALKYVVRAMEDVPIALVLRTAAPDTGSSRHRLVQELLDEALVTLVKSSPAENPERERGAPPDSAAFGVACCRAGAVRSGSHMLAKALAQPGDRAMASAHDEATAWRYLAMAMLTQGQFGYAATAVSGALALEQAPAERRLLRRISMAAQRGQGNAALLHQMGVQAGRDLATEDLGSGERAWLRLDAALGSSLEDPEHIHEAMLRGVVALPPGSASPQCRAIAHLWLGAFLTLKDELPAAIEHQRAGLELLDSLDEESRSAVARVRLGVALFGAGAYAESAQHFGIAAQQAWRTADLDMTAECLCYAARACVAQGKLTEAGRLLQDSAPRRAGLWELSRARLLRLHARAVLAVARHEQHAAAEMTHTLLADLENEPDGSASWILRLKCECAYLLADCADAWGDAAGARAWIAQGLEISTLCAPEERAVLSGRGLQRISRL